MNDVMDFLVKLLPALAALATVIAGSAQSAGRLRSSLKVDAEILSLLPDGEAKTKLESYVAERVDHLKNTDSGTRNWPMFVVALVATLLLGYLAIWLSGQGQWWAYVLAVVTGALGLIFLYGVFETVQVKDRNDEKKKSK